MKIKQMVQTMAIAGTLGVAAHAELTNQGNLAKLMDSCLTNENGNRAVSFSGLKTNTQYQLIAISQGNSSIGDHVRVVGERKPGSGHHDQYIRPEQ